MRGSDRRSVMRLQELAVAARTPRASAANAAAPEPAPQRTTPVVLVIEDDPDLAATLATLLENSGYTATLTSDAMTALCHVRSDNVDLVLLDLGLAGLS